MIDYNNLKNNLYDWIKNELDIEVYLKHRNIKIDEEDFVTLNLLDINPLGQIDSDVFVKSDDETLTKKIFHKYSQKIEIEIYGENSDYSALTLMQSISKSSILDGLELIGVDDETITNTSISYEDGFEKRYMLNCLIYFSLSSTVNVDVLNSINFNGNVEV